MNWTLRQLIVVGAFLASALSFRQAPAADIPCGPAQEGVIFLDGLFTDWKGVKEARFDSAAHIAFGRKHWNNASDASFSVRCNYTSKNVYLAIHVEDEYFACTTKTSKRDRLELVFGRRKLTLMPGDLKKIRGRVLLGRRKAKGVVMAEAKRKKGWAVELKLPKRRIPGYRPGAEGIHLELRLVDVDWRGKTDTVITSGKSRLVVAQVVADLQALLKAMNAAPADVRMRKQADLVGGRGVEQLLWIRKAIAMVGPDIPGGGGYFYFQLPVREIKDIKSIRLLDLNGDGKKEIVVKLIQKGAGG